MESSAKKKRGASKTKTTRKNKRQTSTNNMSVVFWTVLLVLCLIFSVFFWRTYINPYSFKVKALFGTIKYPDGKVRGIDVSHYQGEIDWDKLRNASLQGSPVSFVFIKATEGVDILDENFNQNFHYARRNDIIRGAYHFFSTKSSAEKQARFFCKMVQLEENDLPPVLDVESIGSYSQKDLQKEVLAWLRIVEKHYGVTPILYTSYKFKNKFLSSPEFDRFPYWIAHYYVRELQYKGEWTFWQHTDAGKVDGVKGFVDVNMFNGTYEELMSLTIGAQTQDDEFVVR